MEYVRCECEACQQRIVLPVEVVATQCLCPGCGKPVSIPEHEAPPFVHQMRARLFAMLAILWVTVAIASTILGRLKEQDQKPTITEKDPNAG
jgi:hypothetical protein